LLENLNFGGQGKSFSLGGKVWVEILVLIQKIRIERGRSKGGVKKT
jgi:hypothetical protein